MTGTRTEYYGWWLPIGTRAAAQAFIPGSKVSLCLKYNKFAVGSMGWQPEALSNGEPRRARCKACANILEGNPGMVEEHGS